MSNGRHKETPISLDNDNGNGNGFTGEFISLEKNSERRVEEGREKCREILPEKKIEEIPLEAEKRGIEENQWVDLLRVAAAARRVATVAREDEEWIDETFSFPGDGKIIVEGDLDLSGCTSLNTLPKGLEIGGGLNLVDCVTFHTLPGDIKVGTYLYLDNCEELVCLPHKLEINGMLSLTSCISLTMLPRELIVHGDLHLTGCSALEKPSRKLIVMGKLHLTNCPALTAFPKDTMIGGDVIVKDVSEDILRRIYKLKRDGKIIGEIIYETEDYKSEDEDDDPSPPER